MPTLLHLDCSPQRFSRSVSRQITAHGAQAWRQRFPRGLAIYRDLTKTPLVPLGQNWVDGKDLPAEKRSEEQSFALAQSEELADELLRADTLVIGTPMHNFNVPAVLKLWFDHVILPGKTIRFTAAGAEGLIRAKKAVVVIASGGSYKPEEPTHALDFETPYLKFLLRSLGIPDVTFLHAYGTPQPEQERNLRRAYLRSFQEQIAALLSEPHKDSALINNTEQEDTWLTMAAQ